MRQSTNRLVMSACVIRHGVNDAGCLDHPGSGSKQPRAGCEVLPACSLIGVLLLTHPTRLQRLALLMSPCGLAVATGSRLILILQSTGLDTTQQCSIDEQRDRRRREHQWVAHCIQDCGGEPGLARTLQELKALDIWRMMCCSFVSGEGGLVGEIFQRITSCSKPVYYSSALSFFLPCRRTNFGQVNSCSLSYYYVFSVFHIVYFSFRTLSLAHFRGKYRAFKARLSTGLGNPVKIR